MRPTQPNQRGFHILGLALGLAVVGLICFAGYKVLNGGKESTTNKSTPPAAQTSVRADKNQPVQWAYNEKDNKYFTKTGVAPGCPNPYKFAYTPVDLSLINVIGMPGAYRGYNYKPHGGLRADGTPSGQLDVRLPADATLVGLKRYYEGNPQSLQYLLTFETDCGIAFRFDHLYTLTPAFQKIADTTPQPTTDTRGDPNAPFARTKFKAGEIVATAVGFPAIKNIGFDFGVYDYRQRNEISKNTEWAALHNQYQSLEWFGVCWLDMLPGADAAKANQLALVVLNPAKPNIISDYCPHAPHKTLEFNGGKPTDG